VVSGGDGFADLLARARAGSRDALGHLLQSCRADLLRLAHRRLGPDLRPKGDGGDLVQEAFLEAQRDFAGFRGGSEGELRAWLRRLLVNNLVNFSRRYRATGKRGLARELPLEAGPGGDLPAADPAPDEAALEQEEDRRLLDALARLPADYRQVLLLRHRDGLPFEEIARRMGRSANAAHKLWVRATERVRNEVGRPPDA
jgi:RNA polymerase sigma-70 factor (ECF subfamily)